ncbi:MAG: 16S rRNA (guanine(527)-N(7))-methyltransferase RsmG [Bacteroidales bacterium]|nr:16S rRNA (guanine(527)-N(7))-methyltransferase RsmG [Bacteroidales bacterium]
MLLKYFSNISDLQRRQFADLEPLYREWNAKINVVSRKDIDNLMLHHVLHSLAIAKAFEPAGAGAMSAFGPAGAAGLPAFEDGDRVLDVGTGGGFPGIPLAILFPGVKFTLCDSVGKKLIVAEAVAKALGLDNVEVVHSRVEDLIKAQLGKAQASAGAAFSFVVSRAVTDLSNFLPWVKGGYSKGIYYLKGGDVTDAPLFADRGALLQEIDVALKKNGLSRDNVKIFNICDAFEEEFFEQKRVLFISEKKF